MQDPTTLSLPPEERAKFRRINTEQAISLALSSKWGDAVEANQRIIAVFPNDADALNRLGKAFSELGRYSSALDAYERALTTDATNTIAQKNVARLRAMKDESGLAPVSQRYDPSLFIEEPGKTTVTSLANVAPADTLAPLAAGDQTSLLLRGNVIEVRDVREQFIGQLEPKLTLRLLKLINSGNEYAAAITAIDERQVKVIIRETFQHPNNAGKVAFPTSATTDVRPYIKDSMVRYDLDDDDDDFGDDGDYGSDMEGMTEENAESSDLLEEESSEN
ncbi:MAG: tetratricopeptide repeat protein [Chloroflexota bacterium]